MQAQVDGQRHGLARLGVFGDLHVLDQAAATVLEHLATARHAGQPIVVRQLDALAAVIIQVGKADHMRGHIASRIETAEFFKAIDTRDL